MYSNFLHISSFTKVNEKNAQPPVIFSGLVKINKNRAALFSISVKKSNRPAGNNRHLSLFIKTVSLPRIHAYAEPKPLYYPLCECSIVAAQPVFL